MSQVSDYSAYQNSTQRLKDSYETERAQTRAQHEKELKSVKEESDKDLQTARRDFNQRLQEDRAQARAEVKRLKEDLYDSNGKTSGGDFKKQQAEHNELYRYRDELKSDADRKISSLEDKYSTQASKRADAENEKINDALAAQRKSNHEEVKSLEQELNQYQTGDRDVEADRAKARSGAIAENERDHIREKDRITTAYDRQIKSMKNHQDDMGDVYERKLENATYNANTNAQKQMRIQSDQFKRIHKQDLSDQNRMENSYKEQLRSANERSAQSSGTLIERSNEDREKALAQKDETYQEYIANKDDRYRQEVAQRDNEIQKLRTTDDPLQVSPFVEKRINDAAAMRNSKSLAKAEEFYNGNLTAEKKRDQSDRSELARNYNERLTNFERDSQRMNDTQNRSMQDSIADMQNNHEQKVADLQESHRSANDKVYEKHSVELQRAQESKMSALQDQHESMNYEKNAALDDAESTRRIQDREWSLKASDQRRSFETKLADQHDQHEKEILDVRLEDDKKLRDQQRNSKRELDDRVRNYEHQIAQQDVAFREKERFLTEHYEEEIDKLKRTNAHLIEKKS